MSQARKIELHRNRVRRLQAVRQWRETHSVESARKGTDVDEDSQQFVGTFAPTHPESKMLSTTSSSTISKDTQQHIDNESIFISIASYRDSECSHTIEDLLKKAKNPKRVFIGVCEQNHPEEDGMLDARKSNTAKKYSAQIRITRMSCFDATGPMLARSKIEKELYQGETYYLVIDSHTMFIQYWDSELIYQLLQCPSVKPVLTCYPDDYMHHSHSVPAVLLKSAASFLRFKNFHPQFGFPQQERRHFRNTPSRPVRSLFWAAGFSFTLGQVIDEVPYDPNYPYVFLGEEISMAARLFCAGWDTFAPTKNIIFHLTARTYRPTFWEQFYKKGCIVSDLVRNERKQLEKESQRRLYSLLTGDPLEPPYGLKSERTLEAFQKFTGLNFARRAHEQHALLGLQRDADAEERQIKMGAS